MTGCGGDGRPLTADAGPDSPRRHLFVLLGGESGLAHFTLLEVLDGRQPLPRLPELPDAITTVWAGIGSGAIYVTPPEDWQIARSASG
jgi:hypothetical protein